MGCDRLRKKDLTPQEKVEPLDWMNLYSVIQRSPFNDVIFGWSNIKRLPVRFLTQAAEKAQQEFIQLKNIESFSTAAVGTILAQVNGNNKIDQSDLLPLDSDPGSKLKPKTRSVLKSMKGQNQLPQWVVQCVFAYWDMTDK